MRYNQLLDEAMSYGGPAGEQFKFTGPQTTLPEAPQQPGGNQDYAAMIDAILKTVGSGMSSLMSNTYKGALPFAPGASVGGAPMGDPAALNQVFPQRPGAQSSLAAYLRR